MKVALVHDYLKEYGGAERVLEALHEIWPSSPVFTTVYLPEFLGPHQERFKNWQIKTSFLQHIPFKQKLISVFRLIAPLAFLAFDFSPPAGGFDVVIVSATGAYTPNLINKKSALQICYCHTPPRYLYGFATAREWKNNVIFRVLGSIANHFLRLIDFKSAQNVDFFVANSKNVAGRIKKFYRKDSVVIYPPVDIDNGSLSQFADSSTQKPAQSLGYFLAGGRLARPKHTDLIIETCGRLSLPLKVFGREFANSLSISRSKYPNIFFLGEVSDEEKLELMAGAKAYIFASEEEDFGITPVEAMSVGTPVIAYKSGGVVESVIDGRTGLFFKELTPNSLKNALLRFSKTRFDREEIVRQAQKFSKERFKKEIQLFVENVYKKNL